MSIPVQNNHKNSSITIVGKIIFGNFTKTGNFTIKSKCDSVVAYATTATSSSSVSLMEAIVDAGYGEAVWESEYVWVGTPCAPPAGYSRRRMVQNPSGDGHMKDDSAVLTFMLPHYRVEGVVVMPWHVALPCLAAV